MSKRYPYLKYFANICDDDLVTFITAYLNSLIAIFPPLLRWPLQIDL